jgi:ubiquinol-cytochrome c reductase cytochrome b subunit
MAEFKQAPAGASMLGKTAVWLENRFPSAFAGYKKHLTEYYAPKNFNVWFVFGVLSILVLAIQIVSGIFLAMHYKPDAGLAFGAVESIMRDVPWGQMSYWGAQVIVNLFSAIPVIGPDLALLIRGDYVVSDATLNRFFSVHVIAIPLVLLGLVAAHVLALHDVGSNNPDGVEIKARKDAKTGVPLDGIPFHPYYTVHDIFAVGVFLFLFSAVVFFLPEGGGYFLEYNNFIPADPMKTPLHIAPVWYFTPFYSMLRATTDPMVNVFVAVTALGTVAAFLAGGFKGAARIAILVAGLVVIALLKTLDAKFWGVVVMGASVCILFALPWLDRSPVKSIRYRPRWHRWMLAVFVVFFLALGYLGTQPPSDMGTLVAQIGTLVYFGFFALMPWWSRMGEFKPVPDRVSFKSR